MRMVSIPLETQTLGAERVDIAIELFPEFGLGELGEIPVPRPRTLHHQPRERARIALDLRLEGFDVVLVDMGVAEDVNELCWDHVAPMSNDGKEE